MVDGVAQSSFSGSNNHVRFNDFCFPSDRTLTISFNLDLPAGPFGRSEASKVQVNVGVDATSDICNAAADLPVMNKWVYFLFAFVVAGFGLGMMFYRKLV